MEGSDVAHKECTVDPEMANQRKISCLSLNYFKWHDIFREIERLGWLLNGNLFNLNGVNLHSNKPAFKCNFSKKKYTWNLTGDFHAN